MLLKIHPQAEFLSVIATGQFSVDEMKRAFLEMLEAVAVHKTTKVLFDGRGLLGHVGTMDRFYYAEFVARSVADFHERGVSPGTQFAYLLKEPVLDPERFGETVAVNRGANVKAFASHEAALRWLGVEPTSAPEGGGGESRA